MRVDFGVQRPYLAARMKRFLAYIALMLGLAALVSPAHARLHFEAGRAEISRVDRPATGIEAIRRNAEETDPSTSRARRNRDLGAPATSRPRTVMVPVIMLADRPLE